MKLNIFTYTEYRYILTILKQHYSLVDFVVAYNKSIVNDIFFAVIRHDVDLDLGLAFELAKIEENLNVKATYFVLVSSDFYNVFYKNNVKILRSMISMGHTIGLHYNPLCYTNIEDLNNLYSEVVVLERLLNYKINVISWHRAADLSFAEDLYSNYLDTTKPPFFNAQMKYFADSHGRWRFGHPLDSVEFKNGYPLHLCFHPLWWGKDSLLPSKRLSIHVKNRNEIINKLFFKDLEPEDFGPIYGDRLSN